MSRNAAREIGSLFVFVAAHRIATGFVATGLGRKQKEAPGLGVILQHNFVIVGKKGGQIEDGHTGKERTGGPGGIGQETGRRRTGDTAHKPHQQRLTPIRLTNFTALCGPKQQEQGSDVRFCWETGNAFLLPCTAEVRR